LTRYLLDTNVLSDIARNPLGAARIRLVQVGEGEVCTSIIVAAELRFGLEKRGSAPLRHAVEGVLKRMAVLPFDRPADEVYSKLRVLLEAKDEPIGANDLLIAAHAVATGCILVTDNEREFARVPGLTVENWRR